MIEASDGDENDFGSLKEEGEKEGEGGNVEQRPIHIFPDGTKFMVNQTFKDKTRLKLLVNQASVKKFFYFKMAKSCSKFLQVEM